VTDDEAEQLIRAILSCADQLPADDLNLDGPTLADLLDIVQAGNLIHPRPGGCQCQPCAKSRARRRVLRGIG